MITSASAYFPPFTRHHVRQCPQARLIEELQDFPPPQCLGEDVGQDPFKLYLLLEQQFVDDVELAVNMPVFFQSTSIATDGDGGLVIGQDEGRLDHEKSGEKRGQKTGVLGSKIQSHVFGLTGQPSNTSLSLAGGPGN
jgi:hypothetical protein